MVESLYEGFLIGLFTSAPVGPIALLCIQRTLQKGRWHGFYSGLGAATSDFLYALIAMLGLSFVMNFIQQNEFLIQVIGSTVVMLFGVYIFFQNPASGLKKNEEGKTSYSQEYVTSFLLTLSNPLMIFLFLGLFARFSFLTNADSLSENILGMVAVFVGSSSWWFTLTLIASIFHKKFNIRGLWFLNKITGSLIFIIALGGLILTLTGASIAGL